MSGCGEPSSAEAVSEVTGNYTMAHNFNSALFRVLLDYLKPEREERIIDLGCSRGFYVRAMESCTGAVVGVDISEAALKEAVTPKVEYGDITNLDYETASFDKAYCLHTIEHIPDLRRFFSEMARVLRPGGIAIVVYPWEPFRGFQAIAAAVRQHGNPLRARSIHLHRITPHGIDDLIAGTTLKHVESKLVFARGIQYLTKLLKTPAS
jgi:SAM-dependent methyltransferase